ncbi:MAG: LysR family transcriptional regulator [bacterium]|nr:LysR family transcriptional regulator [bacterium]
MKKELNFDLKQLRSFLEVLKENSFTRASRNLKIGQATISHHLGQLEEMLGVELITRTSKRFLVTPQGKIFEAFCEELFANINKLKANLDAGTFGGVTRISASTIPSTYILPGVAARLKKEYPDFFYKVDISDSREVVEKIKEGKTEIGVSGKQLKHPSLLYQHIYSDELVLIGAPEAPRRVSIEEIPGLPLVERESGSGTKDSYERILKEHGIHPSDLTIVFESSTSEGVKESVIAGIGMAFISRLAIRKELSLKMLKIIPIDDLKIDRDFFLVTQKNRHLSPPAEAFIAAIKSIADDS